MERKMFTLLFLSYIFCIFILDKNQLKLKKRTLVFFITINSEYLYIFKKF